MKSIIFDLLSGMVFLAILLSTNNIAWAIYTAIGIGVAQLVFLLVRREKPSAMMLVGLILVIGLGAATIMTKDPLFVMLKPTLIDIGIGATMLQPGWMARYLSPAQKARLTHSSIVAVGYVYAATILALAGVNLAFALLTTPATWAVFAAFGPPATFGMLGVGAYVVLRYFVPHKAVPA